MSTLTLYGNTKITPAHNFKIDDIESYLSQEFIKKDEVEAFQYVKHGLKISIKVDVSQRALDDVGDNYFDYFEYCSIKNEDFPFKRAKTFYYFIIGKKWTSKSCIELNLYLDSVNTFWNFITLSKKTRVLREHKDRCSSAYSTNTMITYTAKIDRVSEGIYPALFKSEEEVLLESIEASDGTSEKIGYNFYLAFRNAPSQTPTDVIEALLYCDRQLDISSSGVAGRHTGEYSFTNITGIIMPFDKMSSVLINGATNVGKKIIFHNADIEGSQDLTTLTLTSGEIIIFADIYISLFSGHDYYIYDLVWNGSQWVGNEYKLKNDKPKIYIEGIDEIYKPSHLWSIEEIKTKPLSDLLANYNKAFFGDSTLPVNSYIPSIDDLDRTDPTLLSVVRLPYSPMNLSGNLQTINVNEAIWNYDTSRHVLYMRNPGALQVFLNNIDFKYDLIPELGEWGIEGDYHNLRRSDNLLEPKIHHSDYYVIKFVYDSFSYTFKPELLESERIYLTSNFVVSSGLSSRFMFDFPNVRDKAIDTEEADYDYMLTIVRNNEIPIYTSAYLNYMRTAYNYDVKTKERKEANLILSTIGGVVGSIATIAGGVASENPFVVGTGISIAATTTINAITTANTLAQMEADIKQKQYQTSQQAVSVSGVNDVDLLAYYSSGNKAKIVRYRPTDVMRNALLNVFYYTGYNCNEMKVPNVNSRRDFNFLQAELVFEKAENISKDFLDDIASRAQVGITFIHHTYKVDLEAEEEVSDKWDIDQIYANLDMVMLPRQLKANAYPITRELFQEEVEFIFKRTEALTDEDVCRMTTQSGIDFIKRSAKDPNVIIEAYYNCDTLTLNNLVNHKTIDVRNGSTKVRELNYEEFDDKDYRWSIIVHRSFTSTYNDSVFYDFLYGYYN